MMRHYRLALSVRKGLGARVAPRENCQEDWNSKKDFDSPDGKKVVRQGLLYLYIKGLLATSTPAGSRTLNLASSDRSLYY